MRWKRYCAAGQWARSCWRCRSPGATDTNGCVPVSLWLSSPGTKEVHNPMPDSLEGGCACGQIRYRLRSAPLFVHCCHCKDCQRQTGTAFVLNALIETDRVESLSGEATMFPMPTDSGRPHDVARCAGC